MPRKQKPPTYLTCRGCDKPLPHGERDPLTKRLYRSDMQFCPPERLTPEAIARRKQFDRAEFRDMERERKFLEAPFDKYDRHNAKERKGRMTVSVVLRTEARESCKDQFHNRMEPTRLKPVYYNDAVGGQHVPKPVNITDLGRRLVSYIASILKRGGPNREYAITLAMQSADDDLLDAAIAGAVLAEKLTTEQADWIADHGKRLDTARSEPRDRFGELVSSYTVAPTGPAPTGAQCPNCLQPDTDHFPGCAVASGEDPDAVTIPGT